MNFKILFILISVPALILFSCKSRNETKISEEFNIDTTYYEHGKIQSIKQYNDSNQLHGYFYEYYPNGVLKYQANFWKDSLCGDIYTFYSNGNLKAYNSLDLDNKPFFGLYMDSSGNITKQMGCIMSSEFFSYPQHQDYKLNQEYTLLFVYANPKNGFNFFIDSIILDEKKFTNYNIDLDKSELIVDILFKQIGKYKMTIYSSLLNKDINYFKNNILDVYFDVKTGR